MEQEIKFRAWDKKEEEMIYDGTDYLTRTIGHYRHQTEEELNKETYFIHWITPISCPDRFILMQLTGLPEKNKKEIYDKDIVRWGSTEGRRYTKEVNWNNEKFCWNLGNIPYCELFESGYFQTKIQLIGNSFDNPELLEKKHI